MDLAKGDGIAVILVGHVTKDGSIAGPKTLEHLVDAVLDLEGERYAALRLAPGDEEPLRLDRRGRRLRDGRDRPARGRRPGPGVPRRPRRIGPGQRRRADPRGQPAAARRGPGARRPDRLRHAEHGGRAASTPNRLSLLIAVLGRRAGIGLGSHDVYANLAGGLSVAEPALDLPLALALASSLRDRPIPPGTVAIGEVGLLGELRTVVGLERRLREAARLGFDQAIVPAGRDGRIADPVDGLDVIGPGRIRDAIEAALADRPPPRGEAVPRDARLTARPVGASPLDDRRCRGNRLIRYIRVLGAALGGAIGLALATSGDGLFDGPRLRGRAPGRLGRRLGGRRVRDPAVPDGRARPVAHPPGRGSSRRPSSSPRSSGCSSAC